MVGKNIKLINVIQVMLVHRILPCQSRTCPLWEFDSEKHQTLERLFGTTHEDVWKLLFKGNETPPAIDSDRGHDLAHPASAVSHLCLKVHPPLSYSRKISKNFTVHFSGMDRESGADSMSGSAARRISHPAPGEDAGSSALQGAGEEGQEKGQGGPKWPPP